MIDPFSSKFNFKKDISENVNKYLRKVPSSFSKQFKGSEQLKWLPTDTEHAFNTHYELYPEILEYYIENPISYNINNYFCRSDFDFKVNKDLKVDLFVGCSHTFGIGLHEKHLWWNKISEYTGNIPINLGVAGSSSEEQLISLTKVIDLFDVQNVVWYTSHFYRYTYPVNESFETFNFDFYFREEEQQYPHFPYKEAFVKDYLIQDDYTAYYSWKHATAASGLCLSRDIPFYINHKVDFDSKDVLIREINSDGIATKIIQFDRDNNIPARDIVHMTVNQHTVVGNHMLELFKNNKQGYNPYNKL